ncbi:hypothetical protein KKG90_05605, partial [Candidatus Bipolaricaulota bacterium]|nr:hypothetical protein [Candidatus Bipolaricaulota bacterium]
MNSKVARRQTCLRWDIGSVLIFAMFLAGIAAILPAHGNDAFERFLGTIHPALAIALAAFLAIPAMHYLMHQHGFSRPTWRQTRRGLPVTLGFALIFAIGVIAVDLGLRYPETINVPLPQALFFYPPIGFFVDLVFHTILPALLLLLQRPLIHWLGERRAVWIAILLAASVEPLLQVIWAGSLSWTELYTAISVFLFGIAQLMIFRKYGFLAMYSMRLTYYLFWHIVWGYFRL